MKTLRYSGIILSLFFLISSCSKEFSTEGGITGGFAAGSLKNIFDECQPVTLNGTYTSGKALNDSNSVVVQVNFSSPGTYQIFTDTVNGFYFSRSAYTVDSGLQNITLKSVGTPLVPQTTDFTVFFDTSFCSFSVPVISDTPAVYTLQGSGGSCSNADVQGTYETRTALGLSNKVFLQVDVTEKGSYVVSTDRVNGMSFKGAGNFTSTGVQTIALQGSGTPAMEGTSTIPFTAGGNSCSFDIDVAVGTTPVASDSAWSFNQGSNFYYGSEDGAFFMSQSGTGVLTLNGSVSTGDTSFSLDVVMLGQSTLKTGTYKSNTGAYFSLSDASGSPIYSATPLTTNVVMTIIISSYDTNTKIVIGSFSGNAVDAAGAVIPITGGKFKMVLD